MAEMDFQQVHRYLDQGAPWEICTVDPVAFSIDAIQRTRRPDRPILLAETGAVNDRHTGPFRYYRMDERGIIFHDTTYPGLFRRRRGHWAYLALGPVRGSEGPVAAYRPLADLIAGVQLDAEGFQPVDLSTERAWFLGLRGHQHLLVWVRNKADSWHAVLRDEVEPAGVANQIVDLRPLGIHAGTVHVLAMARGQRRRASGGS